MLRPSQISESNQSLMFSRSFMLSLFVRQLSKTFEELMNLLSFQFTMLNMFDSFTLIQFVRLFTVSRLQ